MSGNKSFKIDLIVWKFVSIIFMNASVSTFKIDLIVWKYKLINNFI